MRARWIIAMGLFVLPALLPTGVSGAEVAGPIVVRVDARDPANQQKPPPNSRYFEYTDFFPRQITVRRGQIVDFQTQPQAGHVTMPTTVSTGTAALSPVSRRTTTTRPSVHSRGPISIRTG
jgi:hypothetical protein